MPIIIQFQNGYEVFPFCGNEYNESLEYDEILIPMGDGYYRQLLTGTNLGTRSWNISLRNVKGGTADLDISYNSTLMTPAAYIRDLFKRTKSSGTPFCIKSEVTDTYHLCIFKDSVLSLSRAVTKLYTTGIQLVQVRLPGVTGFG